MNKQQYEKWLRKRGVDRVTIKKRKRELGSPNSLSPLSQNTLQLASLGALIPPNGSKSSDSLFKEQESKKYPTMPAYNKGPIMVVSKSEIPYAGKK